MVAGNDGKPLAGGDSALSVDNSTFLQICSLAV